MVFKEFNDSYIKKLLNANYRVSILDQVIAEVLFYVFINLLLIKKKKLKKYKQQLQVFLKIFALTKCLINLISV